MAQESSFEELVTELYVLLGHHVDHVVRQGAYTSDLIIKAGNGEKWVVRCEQSREVNDSNVRDFFQVLEVEKAKQGAIITSGIVTPQTRQSVTGKPIHLLDNNQFQDYLRQARTLAQKDTPTPARDSSQAETKPGQTRLDFITLACPSCGGKLEITNDIERFACAHCGREHIVKRSGGTVSLAPIVDSLKKVETGVDKTAAELALARLQREIDDLDKRRRAVILMSLPELSLIPLALLVTGVLLSLIALAVIREPIGPTCLSGGILLGAVGFFWIFSHLSASRNLERSRQAQLELIDDALTKIVAEQAKYLQIVSQ